MPEETTITVSYQLTIKPDNEFTLEQKEEAIKQDMLDQAAAIVGRYDYGLRAVGSVNSTMTGATPFDHSKPDYTE